MQNSGSYSDTAINRLEQMIEQKQADNFKELFFLGRYWDDFFVFRNADKGRIDGFFSFLNPLDCGLKFTTKIGQGH